MANLLQSRDRSGASHAESANFENSQATAAMHEAGRVVVAQALGIRCGVR
jgi:hypothetical protein